MSFYLKFRDIKNVTKIDHMNYFHQYKICDTFQEKTVYLKRTKTDSGKLVKYYSDGLTILKELGKLNP